MNAYLVVMRCNIDDLPLFLTSDIMEARTFAKQVTEEAGANECAILKMDRSDPISVQIWEFTEGRLSKVWKVTDFTE